MSFQDAAETETTHSRAGKPTGNDRGAEVRSARFRGCAELL